MGGKKGSSGSSPTGGHRGGSEPRYSPNDDRANAKNPTSDAYAADQANQASQKTTGS